MSSPNFRSVLTDKLFKRVSTRAYRTQAHQLVLARRRWLGSANTAYATSKGGIVGFARALMVGHAGTGIRANVICPGFLETPMSAYGLANPTDRDRYIASILVGRTGVPENISGLVVFLASDASAFVNDALITLDGGTSLL